MDHAWLSNASTTPPTPPVTPAIGYPSAAGTPTNPGEWWYHAITEELRNAIVAGGLTPAYNNVTQLAAAINAIAAAKVANLPRFEINGSMNSVTSLTPTKIFKGGSATVVWPATTPPVPHGYNPTTGEVTVQAAWGDGWYRFEGYIALSASAGGVQHIARILLNNAIIKEVALTKNNTSAGSPIYEERRFFSVPLYLHAGDIVAIETLMGAAVSGSDGVLGLWLHYRREQ